MTPSPHTEPCPECGSAMADDQRYCLECGARRGDARIDYRPLLNAPPVAPVVPPPTVVAAPASAPAAPAPRSAWTLPTALATVACLLLAIGIGVLIGRGGDDGSTAAAPAPQVIRVDGVAAAATTPAATTPTADTEAADDAAADAKADTKASAKKKAAAAKTKAADEAAAKATSGEVKSLESTSGDDYAKQSAKLPKEVGTAGPAPKKDDKPAAGGGEFESIG